MRSVGVDVMDRVDRRAVGVKTSRGPRPPLYGGFVEIVLTRRWRR
jgi:hypothetical protein